METGLTETCEKCGRTFTKRGFTRHADRCKGKKNLPPVCQWCGMSGNPRNVRAHEQFCTRNPQRRIPPIVKTHDVASHLSVAERRIREASERMLQRDNAMPKRTQPKECERCHCTPCQTPLSCGAAKRATQQHTIYRVPESKPTKRRRKA